MGTFVAENENLVPDEDKFYFGNATVVGLRKQLRENGLPANGRKFQLYTRLVSPFFPFHGSPSVMF